MAHIYNITFVGDYATLTTTVTVPNEDEDNTDAIIDKASTDLINHYGINPTEAGLAAVDIEINKA
jgi:hypothetical protein